MENQEFGIQRWNQRWKTSFPSLNPTMEFNDGIQRWNQRWKTSVPSLNSTMEFNDGIQRWNQRWNSTMERGPPPRLIQLVNPTRSEVSKLGSVVGSLETQVEESEGE